MVMIPEASIALDSILTTCPVLINAEVLSLLSNASFGGCPFTSVEFWISECRSHQSSSQN
ncbi:hypothetical protein SLEP1_g4621 [Rubroshorea leprosula]|uniref:Uncharacterized protein n=1 Tax=Rubroshorea leprosula TaxID=152421 RepID=A0AAV5HZS1_9ROSI|nr:hypothetical protein SLEP1_g4621 [Rubroshorea leprosula]